MFHFYFLLLLVSKYHHISYVNMLSRYVNNVISIFNLPSSFKSNFCNIPMKIKDGKTLYNANDLLRYLFDKKRPARNSVRGWLIIIQIVFVFSYFYQQNLFKFVISLL